MSRSHDRPSLSLGKKLAFSLFPTLCLLLAAEAVVRWTGVAERCSQLLIASIDSQSWTCDPILGFKTNPDLEVLGEPLNREGFRTHEFWSKRAGVYRILALGDSCTFGEATREDDWYVADPYPQRLEELAAQRLGPGVVEVLNAGVRGYNTFQGLMLLRTRLRGLQPDLITARFGWNDHFVSPGVHMFHEPSNPVALEVQDLLLHTALYPFALRLGMELLVRRTGARKAELPHEWRPNITVEEFKHNLRRIVEVGKRQGANVWLLTAPDPFTSKAALASYQALPRHAEGRLVLLFNALPSFQRLMEIHQSYNVAVRQVSVELGVPVVDFAAAYAAHHGEPLFSIEDPIHPTQAGHDLEAEILYKRLVSDGTLEQICPVDTQP